MMHGAYNVKLTLLGNLRVFLRASQMYFRTWYSKERNVFQTSIATKNDIYVISSKSSLYITA